jgi:hypothetical protein
MRPRLTAALLSFVLCPSICVIAAASSSSLEPELPTTVLETVVVSGRQPGPGLWKISRGDRVLWLLGTIAPLPKRMQWESDEVEQRIADSQELILAPTVSMKAQGAMFGGLFLIPSLLRARNNPEKERLEDVLPAPDYARWSELKRRYLGRDRGVEKRRPIVAAAKLQEEALDDADLTFDITVTKVAKRAARRKDVALTQPRIEIVIADPKSVIREFSDTALDDLDCFRRTLDRIERDIETMKLRANAWALGDIELLQSLATTDNSRACIDALLETRIAEQNGFADLESKVDAAWMEAAEAALAKNAQSFALLPMSRMLRPGGFLDRLRERGYTVEAPPARALGAP